MVAEKAKDPQELTNEISVLPDIPVFQEKDIANKEMGREVAGRFHAIIIKQREFIESQQKEIKIKEKNQTRQKKNNEVELLAG